MSVSDRSRRFPERLPRALCLLAATLVLLTLGWGLSTLPFYTKGEPREGLVVWDMAHGGGWVLPLRNGTDIPSKPPLFHWLAALTAGATGGVSELSIRLPSAALGVLGVGLTFLAGVRAWGPAAGWVAALTLATSFEWVRAASTARVDMTLTFFMLAGFLTIWRLDRAAVPSALRTVGLATVLALATLAKGPVGAVLPVLTAGVYMGVRRNRGLARTVHPLLGIVVLTVVAGSWYALAVGEGGAAFVTKQIVQENVLRFLNTEGGGRGHAHSVFYLVPAFLGGMAPWSLFFPAVAVMLVRRRRHLAADGLLYPLVWLLTVFAFYSVASGKRSVYLLPAYPAAALLLGAWWASATAERTSALERRLLQIATWVSAGIFGAAAVALAGLAAGLSPVDLLAGMLAARDLANLRLLDGIAAPARLPIAGAALALGLLALGVLRAARRDARLTAFARIATATATAMLLVQVVYHPALAAARTFKPFMARVRAEVGTAPLFFHGAFDYGAVYYAQRHIATWEDEPRAPGSGPVFLLMRDADWKALPVATRAALPVVDRSRGTGPKGDRRLVLVHANGPGLATLAGRAGTGPASPAPMGHTHVELPPDGRADS